MEKRYDISRERELQAFWREDKTYAFEKNGGRPVFSIDTPPPTVSGDIHIGHIFSYTQAEIVARFRRMAGYNVYYPFGFDDNGLPTERLTECLYGVSAANTPPADFRALCEKTAAEYAASFRSLWEEMGFSADWEYCYSTAGAEMRALSQRMFIELAKSGKAYRRKAPSVWCPECRTAVAQADCDTMPEETEYLYVRFMCGEEELPVATTRPELLCAAACVFVNGSDARYAKFIGKEAAVPLYGRTVPVIADSGADPAQGSGAVMCATFGDAADAEWYMKHDLPGHNVIREDGRFKPGLLHVGGLYPEEARKKTAALLADSGLLIKTEPAAHTVSVHERCGCKTEILLTEQWYISLLNEKPRLLEAADKITWRPLHMKERFISWTENLKWDWSVSRRRPYGVPIPVWYCARCGAPVFAEAARLPVDPRAEEYGGVCTCGCAEFFPETDVLDTWATSSLTPILHRELAGVGLPMGMRPHAHEIIRTWTFYSIARAVLHEVDIPWSELMISGFVTAKDGGKLSKSKNNSADSPLSLVKTHSADALRYWTAGAKLGSDTAFSPDMLSEAKRFLTKLWNAARFASLHLEGFAPGAEDLLPIDCWILARAAQATKAAREELMRCETGAARREIDEFFWKDFCGLYIELAKERLYEPEKRGRAAQSSAKNALYRALLMVLKLYAPFVPHITEAIYRELFAKKEGVSSVHRLKWAETEGDAGLLAFGEEIKEALAASHREKSALGLSLRDETALLEIETRGTFSEWYAASEADIKACAAVGAIRYKIVAK